MPSHNTKRVPSYRAYSIKHSYDVSEFLEAYRLLLQRALDGIWAAIIWKHDERNPAVLNPIIPKSNEFKKQLRDKLMEDWGYSKHYVDSAIREAYSLLKSWRRNYLKGRRKGKPVIKKRFVRVKETLYSYREGKIKVSIRPYEEYLIFDISRAWFSRRAKEGELGELILKERYLTITFRFKEREEKTIGKIAWDCNVKSLDGFNPKLGWIRIDLGKLFHIHRVYELKRKRLQPKASKKPSLKRVLAKYSRRERNRAKNFVHKLTTFLSREYKGYVHGFEDLRKDKMFRRGKNARKHNREIAKSDWKIIQSLMSYKSRVVFLNPKDTSRRCSRCGMVNAPKGAFVCECGLRMDRQLNAAINLYLQMEGLSPSPELFEELMAWSGFALTGEEASGLEAGESQGLSVDTYSYLAQNPVAHVVPFVVLPGDQREGYMML
ncbi:MAG: transposase [Candidatus Korarchaeum sp.]